MKKLILALTGSSLLFAKAENVSTTQWELLDLNFQSTTEFQSPFEAEISASCTSPSGKVLTLPLFYDGEQEFILRIAPPEQGRWTYKIKSSASDLDGKSGVIEVGPPKKNQHGPIGIHPQERHRFAYADGSSYFPIAFECDWLFALDALNKEGIPKTDTLLTQVAANGFNQVVMNVYAYDVNWPKDPKLPAEFDYSKPSYSPFGGTNEKPDFSTLNVEFFQHFDRVMNSLNDKEIAAHLMIYVWNKQVNWPESESAADNLYFDYVVKRYQAFPNLIWDISKEATGYGHNDVHYITNRIDRLRDLDQFDRLVTVHDIGYCNRFPKKVDFASTQTWSSDLYSAMKKARERQPDKPILNIEHGGYERGPYHVFTGDYLSPEVCLERCWQCIFAGIYPTHYWQDTSWSVVIHDPAALQAEQRPKFHYYRHMADLVEKLELAKLVPSKRKYSGSGFTLTNHSDRFVYFVPKENTAIKLTNLPIELGTPIHLSWHNPHTGEVQNLGVVKLKKWHTLSAPEKGHFNLLSVLVQKEE